MKIKRQAEQSQGKAVISPVSQLASEHSKKNLAYIFAFCVVVFSLLAVCYSINNLRSPQMVFAVDGSNTIHFGPLDALNIRSPVFQKTALNATQAALQRSPVGLDLPELAQAIFRADAFERLQKDVAAQLPDLVARDLHLKPEISKITALAEKEGTRLIEVRGQWVGSGVFRNNAIAESPSFQLLIAIVENPNLGEANFAPFIVSDYRLAVGEDIENSNENKQLAKLRETQKKEATQ